MFNTKNLPTEEINFNKYIDEVGKYTLKINKISLEYSSKGNPRVIYDMESAPVDDPKFTPADGAEGRLCRVRSYYLAKEERKIAEVAFIALIASKMGEEVREKLDAKDCPTFEEFIEHANNVLTMGDYAIFRLRGEMYTNNKGYPATSLYFFGYKAVASIEEGYDSLPDVDPHNEKHLKPIQQEVNTESSPINPDAY